MGCSIFQSPCLHLARLSNNFISDSFSLRHISVTSRSCLFSPFISYSLAHFTCAVCFSLFNLPPAPTCLNHSACLIRYLFHLLTFVAFYGRLPHFLGFTPGRLANLSPWHSLSCVPQPSVSICLISHQHMSFSPVCLSLLLVFHL